MKHCRTAQSAACGYFIRAGWGCITCHHSWNLSGPIRTEAEPDSEPTFHNTGLPIGAGDPEKNEFKTPTLRNVALTAPYMHDGTLATLEDVIRHYEKGGGRDVTKSGLLRQFTLDEMQRADLIEFMEHLTDERFIQRAVQADPNPGRSLPPHCSDSPVGVSTAAAGLQGYLINRH